VIGSLRGILADKKSLQITVEVGGVGYQVQVPFSTFSELGEVGSPVHLLIHTHLRSERLSLFGFRTDRERQMFEQLIQVSGIGPRTALALLSGLGVEKLLLAVRNRDPGALHRVPGIGKKTSARLILELQDRLQGWWKGVPADGSGGDPSGPEPVREDVISALVNLGYRGREARSAVERAGEPVEFEALLKQALKILATR